MEKEYWIFKDEPNSVIHKIMAETKKEAKDKFSNQMMAKFKFISKSNTTTETYSLVVKEDWLRYNFSKVSTICKV